MITWLAGLALAAGPSDFIRDGKPIRGGRISLVAVQVEAFEGRLYHDPDGAEVSTPPFPDEVDLDAVAAGVREELRNAALRDGLALTEAPVNLRDPLQGAVGVPPGFEAVRFDGWVPRELQRLLSRDRGADGVMLVRISLGWCPVEGATAPLTADDGVLCVRSPEEVPGAGPAGAMGYVFLQRLDLPSRTVGAKRPTVIVKRYAYTELMDSVYGDRPIRGTGPSRQVQAETAARAAARALIEEAVR